jgi:Protein of unknown function VcgC/VcgE (DUF2780)
MKTFATIATIAVVTAMTGCTSLPTQDVTHMGSMGMPSAGTVSSHIPMVGMPSVGSVAGQFPSMGSAAGMAGTVAGTAPVAAQAPSLVSILVQKLGITPQQATGGAGSIFSMAKQSMSPTSFGQVSQAVPGMSQLLSAAPSSGVPSSGAGGLMGSAVSLLGGGSGLGNMAALAGSFQSLGLNSGMMGKFIPVILQYVQAQGGSGTMGLLQGALMP